MRSLVTIAERDFYHVALVDCRVRSGYGLDSHHGAGIDFVLVAVLHGVQEVFSPHVFDFFYVAVGQPYQRTFGEVGRRLRRCRRR